MCVLLDIPSDTSDLRSDGSENPPENQKWTFRPMTFKVSEITQGICVLVNRSGIEDPRSLR